MHARTEIKFAILIESTLVLFLLSYCAGILQGYTLKLIVPAGIIHMER